MNKREVKLYNILLPIWMLIFWPSWLWLAVITAPYLYFFPSRLLY